MCARDQSSIFSTGEKFCPDYGLLLVLHALTLVARSYVLLTQARRTFLRLMVLDTLVGHTIAVALKDCSDTYEYSLTSNIPSHIP